MQPALLTSDTVTSVKASAKTVTAGSPITLKLAGYARYDTVQITDGTGTTAVLTDVNGAAKITLVIPPVTPTGPLTIIAAGSTGIPTASTTITIK